MIGIDQLKAVLTLDATDFIAGAKQAQKAQEDLARSAKDMEGTWRDANGRLHDTNGRFIKDMDAAGASAERMSGRFGASAEKLKGNMESFGRAGIVALGGVGAAAAGLLGHGVKIAADMEQAKIGFTTMLGSAEKADAFIRKLQDFAAKTPFEFAGLQESASKLLAVGVNAERVIPIMTVLGDATSAVGTGAEGIDRAVMALTQMQQKGKVTGEEMLQLVEAGIPAWDALAAKLKVDVATAQDKVSKGQVKVNDLFTALETRAGPALQRVSGMMDKQSASFTGMLSTLKDTFDQQMATLAKPLMEGLKGALPVVTDFVDRGIKTITPAVQTASIAIGQFFTTLTTGVSHNDDARNKVEQFAITIRNSFQWLLDNKEVIIGAVVAIGVAWTASMAMAAAETIAATWPFMLLVGVIGGAVALGIRLWNQYGDTIRQKIDEVRPKLESFYKDVIQPFTDWMRDKWNTVWDVVKEVFNWLVEHLPEIEEHFKKVYEQGVKPLLEFIGNNQEQLKNLAIGLAILLGILVLLAAIIVIVAELFTVLAAAMLVVAGIVIGAVVVAFMKVIQVAWDVFNNVRDALGGVIDVIEGLIQVFWDLAQNAWSAIQSADHAVWGFVNAVVQMVGTVIGKITELYAWFRDLPFRILSSVGDLGSTLWNAGRELISGLMRGISERFEDLKRLLGSVSSFIVAHKGPPAADLRLLEPTGRMIMQGLMTGIDSTLPTLHRQLGRISSGIPQGLAAAAAEAQRYLLQSNRGSFYEDFSFAGMSANGAKWNDALARLFYEAGPGRTGDWFGANATVTGEQWNQGMQDFLTGVQQQVTFNGNTDGAFATAFMKLVREGQIQIAAA